MAPVAFRRRLDLYLAQGGARCGTFPNFRRTSPERVGNRRNRVRLRAGGVVETTQLLVRWLAGWPGPKSIRAAPHGRSAGEFRTYAAVRWLRRRRRCDNFWRMAVKKRKAGGMPRDKLLHLSAANNHRKLHRRKPTLLCKLLNQVIFKLNK